LFSDFDHLFDSFLSPTISAVAKGFKPAYDVIETTDHFLMSFDMPGVKKEDIKIEVQGNNLMISGERRSNPLSEGPGVRSGGQSYGKFERSFELPTSVGIERIEARLENGVLNLTLPKVEESKARTIEIQSGAHEAPVTNEKAQA
jgi:HSP20 family protein